MKHRERFLRWVRVAAVVTAALTIAVGCSEREPAPTPVRPAPSEPEPQREPLASVDGIALAIVYDTSGSMTDMVKNASGEPEAKYRIAGRALGAILERLAAFQAASAGAPRRLDVGLWIFEGTKVKRLQSMAPFAPQELQSRVAQLGRPSSDTPLGEGLAAAGAAAFASNLSRRHVLVITDGLNRRGPDPATVLPRLLAEAKRRDTVLGVHFVAFDVAANVFEPLKRLGATVVAATDERTLADQLGFILERKILLEDEEPAAERK